MTDLSPTPTPPLYTQNPLGRFSDRAHDYARYRPSYPPEAIDLILQGLAPSSLLTVADIGAGTGISAQLLAERGARVWAIEPNAAMRAAAIPGPLIPGPLIEFLEGTAEETGLPGQSVDLVLCCQSFHWFNQPVALAEFHRILKPEGRVALMWNDRNLADPFTQEFSEVLAKAADRQIYDRDDRKSGAILASSSLFTNFRKQTLVHSHTLNLQGLTGLVLSSSYIPKTGEAYEQLMVDLQALYQRWASHADKPIVLSYQVKLFLADRAVLSEIATHALRKL
ncbi:MAG: class I SAM-dependent methyltransferase [Elainellaceae cyanobacterium]